jgi:phosphatidate cytidylyltransferase
MRGRWADLRLRALSAAVLVPLVLAAAWVGGAAFQALIGVMALGLALEWVGLVRSKVSSLPRKGRGSSWSSPHSFFVLLLPGLFYIALAAAALLWLRADPVAGRANLLVLLLLVWASDIGAYAAGRAIGGPRLAPRISPGKTVAGALGGLAAAIAVGLLAAMAVSPHGRPLRAALLAAALGIVAQAGDLLESWVKRRFGVKDTGRLIPGHGGLFDRLDALLAAAPAAALLALLAGRGLAWWE